MDFLKTMDARAAAETPREYHLRSQQTGEPIWDGKKACIVLLRGASSRSVQAAIRAEEIERMKALREAKGQAEQAQALEDVHETLCKGAARFIVGFKGMETTGEDGKLRPMDERDIPAFLDLNFVSLPHLLREQSAPKRREGESSEEYQARLDAHNAEWLKPSYAQQILDYARDDAHFLGAASRG